MRFYLVLFTLSLSLCYCTDNNTDEKYNQENINSSYKDGKYCATVYYYNPKTNFSNDYIFEVEVENNKLVKIFFPNGGWLDESHFNPPAIGKSDEAIFTADNGANYKVYLYKNLMNCSFSKNNPESEEAESIKSSYHSIRKYIVFITEGYYTQKIPRKYYLPSSSEDNILYPLPDLNDPTRHYFETTQSIFEAETVALDILINNYDNTLNESSKERIKYLQKQQINIAYSNAQKKALQQSDYTPQITITNQYFKLFDTKEEADSFHGQFVLDKLRIK